MTISTTVCAQNIVGNGAVSRVPLAFPYREKSDIAVRRVTRDGAVDMLRANIDYSIAGRDIVFAVPPAAGHLLTIERQTPPLQRFFGQAQVPLNIDALNATLDELAMAAQDNGRDIGDTRSRAIMVPPGETTLTLPAANVRAGGWLGFDSIGKAQVQPMTAITDVVRPEIIATVKPLRDDAMAAALAADRHAADAKAAAAIAILQNAAGDVTALVADIKNRANHSGIQPIATVDGLPDALSRMDTSIALLSDEIVSARGHGAKADGVKDDTAAIMAAAAAAVKAGRALFLGGTYAVANLKLRGIGKYLHIIGDPVFVQAVANTPCLQIDDAPLQQSVGYRFSCVVVPHSQSSKSNPANIAVNLRGFSGGFITVRLGQASSSGADLGRFHTMVYAASNSPFHYANRIHIIADAVPAPKYCLRYGNGGTDASGNPNINKISAYINALDTVAGDILLDVADTTQTVITGPTLLEACPDAIGIRAGNFTTIRDVWFEKLGPAIDFIGTESTVPNNCRVERCEFSGSHVITEHNGLGAPPTFVECLGDAAVKRLDQFGSPMPHYLTSRSHAQVSAPTVSFSFGGGTISPDQNSLRHRIDHHGRTTHQARYLVTPAATGGAVMKLGVPQGYEIEQVTIGVIDANGIALAVGLGDDVTGNVYRWHWTNTGIHEVNIRSTLRSLT